MWLPGHAEINHREKTIKKEGPQNFIGETTTIL